MRARERRWSPSGSWKSISSALRLQPRAGGRLSETVPSSVRQTLDTPGQPLDAPTRAYMEPRFGQDFSGVRVHNSPEAARSARDVNALAYTAGRDIAFGAGQYAPNTGRGRQLLAHELAHVVQQQHAPAPAADSISQPSDRDESAADRASNRALAGQAPERESAGAGHALQRQPVIPPSGPAQQALPPGSGPATLPEPPKGLEEAAAKALEAAFEEFQKKKLGQELLKAGKDYVLSVDGIPFDILVVGTVATFIAANDPKLPSLPKIPLGPGVWLKIDYSGRVTDLPPLLRDIVTGQSGPQAQQPADPQQQTKPDETKLAVSVTFTWEALADFVMAVGRFFKNAAVWFARGIVKIGSVIGKAMGAIKHELIGMALGGALGAALGGLAGGGTGALVGLGVGAAVGLGFGAIAHALDKKRKV
jgi:hypothetical protein